MIVHNVTIYVGFRHCGGKWLFSRLFDAFIEIKLQVSFFRITLPHHLKFVIYLLKKMFTQ